MTNVANNTLCNKNVKSKEISNDDVDEIGSIIRMADYSTKKKRD